MRAMHPVKVFSTDNAISAEMAAGLLQKEEIPCYKGFGDGRLSEYLYGIFCIWKRDLCR